MTLQPSPCARAVCPSRSLSSLNTRAFVQGAADGKGRAAVQAHLKAKGYKVKSALPKIIKSGYKALNLINFFTVGPDEVRAWTIRKGWLAPVAAGTIHGDFEKHFICIKKYNFTEYEECGGEKEVKAKGKLQTKGKDYVMEDGDIINVEHNARK